MTDQASPPAPDGLTKSDGLPEANQPPETAAPQPPAEPQPQPPRKRRTRKYAVTASQLEEQRRVAAETLRKMGLNKISARRLMRGRGEAPDLDRPVLRRVAQVFFLDSIEGVSDAIEIVQRAIAETNSDGSVKLVEAKVRVAGGAVLGQLHMCKANVAKYLYESGGGTEGSARPSVAIQINNGQPTEDSGFPQVADLPAPNTERSQ